MRIKHFLLLTTALLTIFGCSTQKITREDIEWSDFWWEHEGDQSKPRVLFIGNSISRAYYPEVTAKLSGIANCDRYSTSRSIADPALLQETKIAMGKYRHSVIHFNNGLHGWHLNGEQYEKGLIQFVRFLKKHKAGGCQLIYSLTTPVSSPDPNIILDPKRNATVMERNRIALKVMKENNIPVIDLYGLMETDLNKYVFDKGNLHYKREGYVLMAELISKRITELLK
jgi:hypothetical protein